MKKSFYYSVLVIAPLLFGAFTITPVNSALQCLWKKIGNNVIYMDGSVGVGTNYPASGYGNRKVVHIVDATNGSEFRAEGNDGANVSFGAGNGKGFIAVRNQGDFDLSTSNIQRIKVTSDGKVGIGELNPMHPLQMGSGAFVSDGGVWMNASSRKLKNNIRDLREDDAVNVLENLEPKRYYYNSDGSDEHLGFIAEDVPALVSEKERKGLSSMDIVAVLTKVVQKQNQDIKELKQQLKELKKKK